MQSLQVHFTYSQITKGTSGASHIAMPDTPDPKVYHQFFNIKTLKVDPMVKYILIILDQIENIFFSFPYIKCV